MFSIIPLRSMTRSASRIVDDLSFAKSSKYDFIQREILGAHTPVPCIKVDGMVWKHEPNIENAVIVASGSLYVDVFCPDKREQAEFKITTDNVFKNDKLYYGSPAMFGWGSNTYYKMCSGSNGCIYMNFAKKCESKTDYKTKEDELYEQLIFSI